MLPTHLVEAVRRGSRAVTPLLRLRELFRAGTAADRASAADPPTRFDLHAELEHVLVPLHYAMDTVHAERRYGQLPPITAQRDEVAQVLQVVIQDALDAMPAGGRLRLTTTASHDRVRVEVADDGPRIQRPAESFAEACTEAVGGGNRVPTDRLLAAWCTVTARHGGRMSLAVEDGWNVQRIELALEAGRRLEPDAEPAAAKVTSDRDTPTSPDLAEPVDDADHALGPATAPVTVVEYGDYECPHCAQSLPILNELRDALGERMRFVFRHFPLSSVHPHAAAAASAAEAAGVQGRFWDMHELLLSRQSELDVADLQRHALKLNLDPYRFNADVSGGRFEQRIRRDIDSGKASGVTGTPTYFVNGRRVPGSDVTKLLDAVADAVGVVAGESRQEHEHA
ncbi:MAG: thioredoxin domain-containing protein [Phycisphaerae bacterium]